MLVHQQPLLPPTPAVVHPVPAPRKRRRRAPTTGATEDCFTCRANGAKCDRRRPYCGPCLDIGNECKGYRTQLTWGVGVASRGKLRGMTLPVSIASNISVAERDRRCAVKRKSVDETAMRVKKLRTGLETNNCLGDIDNRPFTEDIERQSIIVNYNFVNMEHPSATSAIHSAMAKHDFSLTQRSPTFTESYSTSMVNTHLMMQSSYLPLLQHPQHRQEYPPTVLNYHKPSYSHDSMNVRPSGLMAASALSDCDQVYTPHSDSPYSLSPSPSDSSIYDGGLIVTNAYLPPSSLTVTSNVPYAPLITSAQPGPQPTDSHNVHQHWGHIGIHQQHVSAAAGNLSDIVYGEEVLAHPDPEFAVTLSPYSASISAVIPFHSTPYRHGHSAATPQMPIVIRIPMELLSPQLTHLIPELKFLIDYYDKTVCPSIVSFDDTSNPYRSHILRLAFQNSALMEAVYALASSHLQQRKKTPLLETRRSSPPRFSSRSSSQSPRSSTSPPSSSSAISVYNSSTNFDDEGARRGYFDGPLP